MSAVSGWPLLVALALLTFCAAACGDDDDNGGGSGDDDSGDDDVADDDDNDDASPPAIEILVDDLGIPHIFAATDEDAFYAAGYQVASERLYQMEMLRRFALGRLSEVIGRDGLLRDRQARTFDFPRWGQEDFALTQVEDPERSRLIQAWVDGINRRVGEVRAGTAPLPFGYRADEYDFLPEFWDDADPYVVLKGAGFANDKTVEFEVALTLLYAIYAEPMSHVQLFKPAHPFFGVPPEDRPKSDAARSAARLPVPRRGRLSAKQAAAAFASLSRFAAAGSGAMSSNNWAVAGRFTDNGRSRIAGDPHLSFGFFGAPYPMQINSKAHSGSYNVAGFAYPGTPGITLGFNEKAIWTATTNMGDMVDIWSVTKRNGKVRIGNEWKPIVKRTERIKIRKPGSPVGEGRVVTADYEDVPGYGVILPPEVIAIPFSSFIIGHIMMNWTGFQARPARWFMELNRVGSIDEFEAAVDRMGEMSYNFVAATADEISYRVGVTIPDRPDISGDRAPWLAMPGDDPGSFWTGETLDREQIPHGRNPKRGWLATANTDPWGFTADGDVQNDPWYYGSFYDAGYRGQRIQDEITRLTQRGEVTLADFQTLQMDVRSRLSDDLLPFLAAAHGRIPTDDSLVQFRDNADLDRIVQLLTVEWDRRMARDSAGALAWQLFMHFVTEGALKDDILLGYSTAMELMTIFVVKVAAMAIEGEYPTGDAVLQEGRDVILLNAAVKAADWINDRYGDVEPAGYAYRDMKFTSFDEAFGMGMPVFTRPTDGGEDTLCVSTNISFSPWADRWVSNYVSVERTIGEFAADGTPVVYVTYPVGNLADPNSGDTQAANADYIEGRYRRFLFSRDEIEGALRDRIVLTRE